MVVLNNVSLKPYNTFGIDAKASFFSVFDDPKLVQNILNSHVYSNLPVLILGGGSNILFTKDFDGLVLKVNLKGVSHKYINGKKVLVTAGAGEIWDDLVKYCVQQGWGGLENLSLIPGMVGAAPIQNIGAYGVELKDVFSHLEALDLITYQTCQFGLPECNFNYRYSVFKGELKNRYLITSVSLILDLEHKLNLSYPALKAEFEKSGENPTIESVANAVIRIRKSKLPDPVELGNAGSFFKNPVIDSVLFEKIKSEYQSVPAFAQHDQSIKVPAAWLIEQCGWKGKRIGDAGVHALQPLVLVNYGRAKGNEILDLAKRIQHSVFERFQIHLEPEVNIV